MPNTGTGAPGASSGASGGDGRGTANTGQGSGTGSGDASLPVPQAPGSSGAALPVPAPLPPPAGSAAVTPGTSDLSDDAVGIDVPHVDMTPIPESDEPASLLEKQMPLIAKLAGAWEQIDSDVRNEGDFAPGGYSRSVVVIDDLSGEFFVYRGFGLTGKPAVMFVSGQFHIDLQKDGYASIGASKVKATTFFPQERFIPLAPGVSITITPPIAPSVLSSWSTDPVQGLLILNGKRYRRASDEVRDSVIRGDVALVDQALDAQISTAMTGTPSQVAPGAPSVSTGANVEFFGTQIKGRYVAFVIDCSGSMTVNGKMASALTELQRAISALPRDTNFYVVFFSNGALEVPGFPRWVKAQSPEASRIVSVLNGVGSDGGTNPAPALERAFGQSPRPDEIFFMTDGIMPPDVREYITTLNGKSRARTRVNTIAFGSDADQSTLSAIAGDHDGQFRAVP